MKISLVVAVYKNTKALDMIFKALDLQSNKNFECIVAEDDCDPAMKTCVDNAKAKYSFSITHVKQKADDGFRKCQILNQAIILASGEFLVFIDGDCIPHKHFIRTYYNKADKERVFFGRRVMLGEKLTKKLYSNLNISLLSKFRLLFSDSTHTKYLFKLPFVGNASKTGIWGCNWGVAKSILVNLNGFDEDYILPGIGEDTDIEWRLKALGIAFVSVRYEAIVFHLHHTVHYGSSEVNINVELMNKKKAAGKHFCENGIVKY